MFKKIITTILAVSFIYPQVNVDKFKQLSEDITTPNTYRTAAGYPGHDYWQQEADYVMNLTIDDETQILYGEETITFHNNSGCKSIHRFIVSVIIVFIGDNCLRTDN